MLDYGTSIQPVSLPAAELDLGAVGGVAWHEPAQPKLRVGLLNNMPDSALVQTERQFRRLIGPGVELRLFSLDTVPRGPPRPRPSRTLLRDARRAGWSRARCPRRHRRRAEGQGSCRRAILPGARGGGGLGGCERRPDPVLVSGRACGRAAPRWHRASAAADQAFRHLCLHGGRPPSVARGDAGERAGAAFALERPARTGADRPRLPCPAALRTGRGRSVRPRARCLDGLPPGPPGI
ncbi:protein of unknown function [Methylorubrum extorquens]|uniref:Uncharacterized protein n=1 Tax=Methylorubrum extorquens TaxID=408 RepID=A0A2N9AIV7_METEX|nr:protein of unknown function [Methylorubrum extorquens]